MKRSTCNAQSQLRQILIPMQIGIAICRPFNRASVPQKLANGQFTLAHGEQELTEPIHRLPGQPLKLCRLSN